MNIEGLHTAYHIELDDGLWINDDYLHEMTRWPSLWQRKTILCIFRIHQGHRHNQRLGNKQESWASRKIQRPPRLPMINHPCRRETNGWNATLTSCTVKVRGSLRTTQFMTVSRLEALGTRRKTLRNSSGPRQCKRSFPCQRHVPEIRFCRSELGTNLDSDDGSIDPWLFLALFPPGPFLFFLLPYRNFSKGDTQCRTSKWTSRRGYR